MCLPGPCGYKSFFCAHCDKARKPCLYEGQPWNPSTEFYGQRCDRCLKKGILSCGSQPPLKRCPGVNSSAVVAQVSVPTQAVNLAGPSQHDFTMYGTYMGNHTHAQGIPDFGLSQFSSVGEEMPFELGLHNALFAFQGMDLEPEAPRPVYRCINGANLLWLATSIHETCIRIHDYESENPADFYVMYENVARWVQQLAAECGTPPELSEQWPSRFDATRPKHEPLLTLLPGYANVPSSDGLG